MTESQRCINWEIINSLAEDRDSKNTIVVAFIESFQDDLQKLNEAKQANNKDQLIFVAHTIKGASSNFCHEETLQELKEVERLINETTQNDYILLIERLEKTTRTIIEELQSALK